VNAPTAKLIRRFAVRYTRAIGERRDATLKLWWSQLHGEGRHAARERLRAAVKLTFDPRKDPTPEVVRAAQRVLAVFERGDSVKIEIVDALEPVRFSTADGRVLVMPMRPPG